MKKDNKGFSLVELIIVIAIMAVLVGLLAPQYIKYVSNSKVSTDISNAQEVATCFNVAFADGIATATVYSGTGGSDLDDSLDGISLEQWPIAKYDSSFDWSVTITDTGVSEITLNGKEIWPDPKSGSDKGDSASSYYNAYHK